MDLIKAIIFGIIEGITEWLPVSSTGHLILAKSFMQFTHVTNPKEFFDMFEVVIQLGAILAVVLIYFKDIWPFTNKRSRAISKNGLLSHLDKNITSLWGKILVSCVPAAVIGLLFDEKFEELFYNSTCVAIALIVFGIAFIMIENWHKGKKSRVNSVAAITYKDALIIGMFQLIAAIFPGVSRSGATIIGALLIGISRKTSAEYTFYLAVPVMFGASLLKVVKFGLHFTGLEFAVLILGMISAFIVSMFIIKFLMNYIKKHNFIVFGKYRIALGILVLILGMFGVID